MSLHGWAALLQSRAAMPPSTAQSAEQMMQILADGGEHVRGMLVEQLKALAAAGGSPAVFELRANLVKVLSTDSHHRVDDEEHSGSWSRSWQLAALVVLAGDDPDARRLMDLYTDRTQEPNRWVRYWTLATACEQKPLVGWVTKRAEAIAADVSEHLMLRCLAWALLAEGRDSVEALAAVLWALAGGLPPFPVPGTYKVAESEPPQPVVATAAALRALRVVPLAQAFERVEEVVDEGPFASYTWDAIWVLGRFGGTPRAAEASHTLARFVVAHRRMREYYDMVGLAVRAIGRLGIAQTDLLINEMESASPGVAVEASIALEALISTPQAVQRLLDLATASTERDEKLAAGLRCMQRGAVVECLDAALRCGQTRREDAARRLLIEIGGSVAVDRAQVRRQDLESRRNVVAEFDARQRDHVKLIALGDGVATWISVGMFVVVFGLGCVMISLTMYLGYQQGYDQVSTWVMTGAGTLLTALGKVGFQGKQVEVAGARAAARLAVFNAYQRRLQQVDLVLAQRFIDGDKVTAEELQKLSEIIGAAQIETQESLLTLMPSDKELALYQRRKAQLAADPARP